MMARTASKVTTFMWPSDRRWAFQGRLSAFPGLGAMVASADLEDIGLEPQKAHSSRRLRPQLARTARVDVSES